MIRLGRINIITEMSSLSSHIMLPREGHLDAALHPMAHVGQRYNFRLVYDPSYLELDHSVSKKCHWLDFYKDAKEVTTADASEPCGKEVDISMFMDSDHAGRKFLADQEVVS